MEIAVLITCFNRKKKTLACLKDIYTQEKTDDCTIDIYVVDGGSTDGTPQAIKEAYPDVNLKVCQGLYWAGGMREAWKEATQHKEYDFFWLLNDDTHLYTNCLTECLKTDDYTKRTYGKQGIYIGSTLDPHTKKFSYGGRKLTNKGKSASVTIIPDNKTYQLCELGNANIMLVSRFAYEHIGGFNTLYTHGIADYDYTLRAVRANIPVMVLPSFVGECEDDHGNNWCPQSIPLRKRISYLYSPKGLAYKEYLSYIKEFFPKEVFSLKCKLWMKTLFPSIWKYLKK